MNQTQPPRISPKLKSAPRVRQVYWCDLPADAQLPEFWKRRPVVIVSPRAKLHGVVTVVPLTSKSQPDNPAAYAFASPIKGEQISWAICDHLLTIAVSRLSPPATKIPRIEETDFQNILKLIHDTIPHPSQLFTIADNCGY